ILATAVDQIVETHNLDYERLWFSLNRTCKWILQRLATGRPLQTNEYHTSTIYSALKKLQREGFVIYTTQFEIEDPYFKYYIEHNVV
ncbi:MAG: hypothetical protein MJZ64_05560, partial [Paludibacteraceae bacterium]|nr:hypothetical protein [Paludibacteraceae bacterium]